MYHNRKYTSYNNDIIIIWWGQENTLILLGHVSKLHQRSYKDNFTVEATILLRLVCIKLFMSLIRITRAFVFIGFRMVYVRLGALSTISC
jgi:hypothetical protein